jgi:serine/threonine protein kinase
MTHANSSTNTSNFSRHDFEQSEHKLLRDGQWANARVDLVRIHDCDWTVKDFSSRSWLVRNTIGRFLLRRELRILKQLSGLAGISSASFRIDAFALATRFLPGQILPHVNREEVNTDFFPRLETLVQAMHARKVVHLDIRGPKNILMQPDGSPAIIDFQSSLSTRLMPNFLRSILQDIDLGGVYKRWNLWQPQTLDDTRRAVWERSNRFRRFWLLRGYPSFASKKRRGK